MPKESVIQNAVLKYLNGLKGCIAENVHGSVYTSGRPDINGCYKGTNLRIELKSPDHGNLPTDIQQINLMKWGRAGAIAFCAWSLSEVQYVIREDGIACRKDMCDGCPVRKAYCFTKKPKRTGK